MAQFYNIEVPNSIRDFNDTELANRLAVLQFLRPKPSPFPLIRIGGTGDGAYLLPDDLEGIEACFSPGVNNFKSFEDSLLESHGIASHMCDKTSDPENFRTPLIKGRQTFRKMWLDITGNDDAISLENWVEETAPGEHDLMLQMDIEGAEYRNILQTDPEVLRRFRIIVIELHALHGINNANIFSGVLDPFFQKLATDFACVHAHPNNASRQTPVSDTGIRLPNTLELTLLRTDRLEGYSESTLITPQLPHPLDISRNVKSKAPQFLDENWLDSPRSDRSRLKQMQAELEYFRGVTFSENSTQEVRKRISTELSWILETLAAGEAAGREIQGASRNLAEIAENKPFRLNAPRHRSQASGRVASKTPFFFHTTMDAGSRITIDLEGAFRLYEVVVANRTNGFFDRAYGLFVIAHMSPDPATGIGFAFTQDAAFLRGEVAEAAQALPGVDARHVTTVSPVLTALHFSNIRLLGTAAPDQGPEL